MAHRLRSPPCSLSNLPAGLGADRPGLAGAGHPALDGPARGGQALAADGKRIRGANRLAAAGQHWETVTLVSVINSSPRTSIGIRTRAVTGRASLDRIAKRRFAARAPTAMGLGKVHVRVRVVCDNRVAAL